jgi:hypothetical protein
MDAGEMRRSLARCVALTQEHRGHGVSTAAYYLARVLVGEGLRVLLIDLTDRHSRLQSLLARGPAKNLGIWTPQIPRPADLHALLDQARQQTRGRVDVLLVDADQALLEHAGGLAAGFDYIIPVVEPTEAGQGAADRIGLRLGDDLPPCGRVGVVFSRVDASTVDELPEQTAQRKLPVLGYYPADYLLAAGDEYSLKGGEQSWPHDAYLFALQRLGRTLMRLVPLHRGAGIASHSPASHNGAQMDIHPCA